MSPASRCPAWARRRARNAGEGAAEIGPAPREQHARPRELGDHGRGADDDVRGLAGREPLAHLADRAERERDLLAGRAREAAGEVGDGVFHRAGGQHAQSCSITWSTRANGVGGIRCQAHLFARRR
jgi:hypothetical protein